MTSRAAQLAVLLRRAQWECDETAHALPEGRVTDERCRTLADTLEELAKALRDHVGTSVIIEKQSHWRPDEPLPNGGGRGSSMTEDARKVTIMMRC